jgi:hypothetical protein
MLVPGTLQIQMGVLVLHLEIQLAYLYVQMQHYMHDASIILAAACSCALKRLSVAAAPCSLLQHEVDVNNFTYKPVPRTDDEEE